MPEKPTQTQKTAWAEIGQCCLAGRIRVLSRAVTQIFDEAIRHHGFTVPQMNMLVCVASFDEVRATEVAEILYMDHTTISRNLDRMIKKGWIEYVPDADGRAKPMRVTAKGKRLLTKALPDWRKAQRNAEQLLGKETSQAVTRRVGRMWTGDQS